MPFRLLGLFAVAMSAVVASAAPPTDPFANCRQQFARDPGNYESSYCIYQVALDRRLWDDAGRLFEALMNEHPTNFWLPLAYGHVHRVGGRDTDRAEMLYQTSASGFRRLFHAEGEILARSNLRTFLFAQGRVHDATREIERLLEIGASVHNPVLQALVWTLQATHIQDTGGDLGLAYRLLKQSEDAAFPNGPFRLSGGSAVAMLQRTALVSLGLVAFRMGRLDEALSVYQQIDDLAGTEGERLVQANAQYNILNTHSLKETLLPTPGGKQKLIRLAERALATAVAAPNSGSTVKIHRSLAELLASDDGSRGRALQHAQSCLDLAVTIRVPHDEAVCSWITASLLRQSDPATSRAAELQALEATGRANSPRTQAYSAGRRMRLSWETHTRPQSVRDALAAIDAIETLRSLQEDSAGSAELFSTWTSDYYWLAGRLLQNRQEGDLELAFSITERMRARALLDTLGRSRTAEELSHPAVVKRRTLQERIAAVQRRLMDPTIDSGLRKESLDELDVLERDEREAQRQIAARFPDRYRTRPSFAGLGDIQSALADDEAMLAFHIGLRETVEGEFGGGSWLVVLTRGARSVYRLPDRAQLAPMVPVFTGLLAREDGLETASAVRLYDELLSAAMRDLPARIARLIVIPDGTLHHLPFDALRANRASPPLAARYQLVVAPSATLWRHWRANAPRTATRRALTLADPELDFSLDANAPERNASLQQGLQLGRLPHARRESRALEHHLGNVESLIGERASERALKERDLHDYGILHLAAHAISDEAHPERSAVLLSAGAGKEDGLLQAREIEGLDLEGRIVVLSACRTVSGAVLSGEGVLSLARAFFEAGAHAVIGSRWPIRDEDAASFFDAFYRRLGAGASLSEALMQAKAEAIAAGRPATAWASVVLLGDGDFRPFPRGLPAATPGRWPTAAIVVILTLLIALAAFHTTRRPRSANAA
jgi:CHAT domain-containing protein/tetratricopeptide (TPR) repeat protein